MSEPAFRNRLLEAFIHAAREIYPEVAALEVADALFLAARMRDGLPNPARIAGADRPPSPPDAPGLGDDRPDEVPTDQGATAYFDNRAEFVDRDRDLGGA